MSEVRLIPGSEIVGDDGTVQAFGLHNLVTGESVVVPNQNGLHDMVMEQERQLNAQPVADSAPMSSAPANVLDDRPDMPANVTGPNANQEVAGDTMAGQNAPMAVAAPTPEAQPVPAAPPPPIVNPGPQKVELNTTKNEKMGEGQSTQLAPDTKAAVRATFHAENEAAQAAANAATAKANRDALHATMEQASLQERHAEMVRQKEEEFATRKAIEDNISADVNSLSSMKIDNNRRWAEASTGDRVVTGIALLLGSIGSAFSGKENPVIKMMDEDIRRDIDAQKASMQNKETAIKQKQGMLGDLVKRYHDVDTASDVAYATAWKSVEAQLAAMAAKDSGPQIEAALKEAQAKAASGVSSALSKQVSTSGGKTMSTSTSEEQIPKGVQTPPITEGEIKGISDPAKLRVQIDHLLPALSDSKQYGQVGARVAAIKRIFNETTPEADALRAEIEGIKSGIRTTMFGASLTESEMNAFKDYVPDDTASADRLFTAFKAIRDRAERDEESQRDMSAGKPGMPNRTGTYNSQKQKDRADGFKPAAK